MAEGFVKIDVQTLTSTTYMDKPAWDVFFAAMLIAAQRPPFRLDAPEPQLEIRSLKPTGWSVPPGEYGFAPAASTALIGTAQLELEVGLAALERLGAPEMESRSLEFDGRRLVRIDGGFLVLNMSKFRSRDYTAAERQRRYRKRRKAAKSDGVTRDAVTVTRDIDENVTVTRDVTDASRDPSASASPSDHSSATWRGPQSVEKASDRAQRESLRRKEQLERIERARLIPTRDPLEAIHDVDTSEMLATTPPRGARRWGPSDAAELHRQLKARGREHVEAVVAFVRESIESRRRFAAGEGRYVEAVPKAWSLLWQYDGEPWARWEQRFEEAKVSAEESPTHQRAPTAESEEDVPPVPTDEERQRMAASARALVDKIGPVNTQPQGGDDG